METLDNFLKHFESMTGSVTTSLRSFILWSNLSQVCLTQKKWATTDIVAAHNSLSKSTLRSRMVQPQQALRFS